jgi:hypothetical protein
VSKRKDARRNTKYLTHQFTGTIGSGMVEAHPDESWQCEQTRNFNDPDQSLPGEKGRHFLMKNDGFWPKTAHFWPKSGQKRRFEVTSQLTGKKYN